MNYIVMQSLEQTSLIKITTILWNQDDIRTLLVRFNSSSTSPNLIRTWRKIENKVAENVHKLLLPETLKIKIINIIKPIGLQILGWLCFHVYDNHLNLILPSNLFWTPQGTIDRKKTAEVLIDYECLDIIKRYELACIYCLENDIPRLWNEIPENLRRSYNYKNSMNKSWCLVALWTCHLLSPSCRPNNADNIFVFRVSSTDANKVAVEYLLPKLTPEEREEYLPDGACSAAAFSAPYIICSYLDRKVHAETLCFLLSQMNEEQQLKVFESEAEAVLKCLLIWPWQDSFLETAEIIWNLLSERAFRLVLCRIIDKIIIGFKDYNYQKLFGIFWQRSPDTLKKHVIDKFRTVLSKLFKVSDKENVRLILKDATVTERERIIFHKNGKDICTSLIQQDKWDLLQFFVEECISSKDLLIKFKEEFEKHITSHFSKKEKTIWITFHKLFDNLIKEDKKRSTEGDDSCSSKRLCRMQ